MFAQTWRLLNGLCSSLRRNPTAVHSDAVSHGAPSLSNGELLDSLQHASAQLRQEREFLEKALDEISSRLKEKIVELNDVKNFTQDILQNIPEPIITLNLEGKITSANRAVEEKLGYAAGDLKGQLYEAVFSRQKEEPCLVETLRTGKTFHHEETVLRRKNGKTIPAAISSSLLRDGRGRITGAIGIFEDLTTIKQMEEKVARSETLSYMGELVAGISHGIKNPLGIISGYVQLLPARFQDPAFRENFIRIVTSEVEKMTDLTKRLLVLGQSAATARETVDLNEIIRQNIFFTKEVARRAGVAVTAELAAGLPRLSCSSSQMNQVVLDLMLNAVHAMPAGGTLAIRTVLEQGSIIASFTDTGCGITEEHLSKIFCPFFTTKKDGSGLGLAIAHRIIEGCGGRIEASSTVNKGSSFVITLPASRQETVSSPSETPQSANSADAGAAAAAS